MTLIVELGSGNTCRNDRDRLLTMIDRVIRLDRGICDVRFKLQLFEKAGDNLPLDHAVFDEAFEYAMVMGYQLSASVFDEPSLEFLLSRRPKFVKLACVPELHYLASKIPPQIKVYCSFPSNPGPVPDNVIPLCCVREYPAEVASYEKRFGEGWLRTGISDHTVGWELFDKYEPEYYERHVVDVREESNPDAGPFAVTIGELRRVLWS